MKRRIICFIFTLLCLSSWGRSGYFYTPSPHQLTSSKIQDVLQDSRGFLWISTEFGLNKFDGYNFTYFFNETDNEQSLRFNSTTCLFNDREGRLWVGTVKGLDRYDAETNSFIHYTALCKDQPRINCLYQLRDGRVLVGTAGYGLFVVDEEKKQLKPLHGMTVHDEDGYFVKLLEDRKGNFWKLGHASTFTMKKGKDIKVFHSPCGIPVAMGEVDDFVYIVCQKGLLIYKNNRLEQADIDLSLAGGREALFCSSYKDHNKNIYLGTRGRGIFVLNYGKKNLERVTFSSDKIDLNYARVSNIFMDKHHNLWIGCQQRGVVLLPNERPQFQSWMFPMQRYRIGTSISSICDGDNGMVWATVQGNGVYGFNAEGEVVSHPSAPGDVEFIYRDKDRNYWVGTDDALYSYHPETGSAEKVFGYDCNHMNDMTIDRYGNIYLSTYARGLCIRKAATGQWVNYNYDNRKAKQGYLANNWVMTLMPDKKGRVWIGTSSGMQVYDPVKDSFCPLGWHKLLEGAMVTSLCEMVNGDIIIGTNKGLYRYHQSNKKVDLFEHSQPLEGKMISYVVQDNKGDVWCATSFGIWQWQHNERRFVCHFIGNGLEQKEYVNFVGLHTNDDRIYFATSEGITSFMPDEVSVKNKEGDELQLTSFRVGGSEVNVNTLSDGAPITEKEVIRSNHFEVAYNDNSITLHFSQLNFLNPENVVIEYRINNARDWVAQNAGGNTISLNHLQAGHYKIQVRAFCNGVYSPVKVFTISVSPPWYSSSLAIILYVALFVLIGGGTLYIYVRRKKVQLDEEKMKFLINATHDIRSPLTLIMSPLRKLKERGLGEGPNHELDIIERNAQRILSLVNQILDVRKFDKQQMHLVCREVDLVQFVSGVFKMYEYTARERGITFHFNHKMEKMMVWIDTVNFDKVVSNLLSNAFKYTLDKGKIEVEVINEDNRWAVVEVKDNGIGLGEDGGKHIFDRFYQGKNSREKKTSGTGIGLNLCKMIVDMHHGIITADNRKDEEQGSVFTVKVPLGTAHLTKEEIEQPTLKSLAKNPDIKTSGTKRNYRVLVVDDDEEIGHYISTELARYYHFTVCRNGREAIKQLLSEDYDVVVSDVMMPEMDGFSLLRLIKTNLRLNHIPVILLTSKNDVVNRLEGLERGADAYMAKPFDIQELHYTIENQMNNILLLKGKFSGAQQQKEKVEDTVLKGNDEVLMERIMKAINKNLSNSDFNVDMLTEEVGISRAQLHRKMKEMTGIPASEFLRNIRLEQAARLLKEQKVNVTQVAYAVGFSNLAHFSTVFRKHFGVSPTEYAERSQEEQSAKG